MQRITKKISRSYYIVLPVSSHTLIQADLDRVHENLYTNEEHANLIYEKGYHGDDIVIRTDITDKNGKPMRVLKRTVTG